LNRIILSGGLLLSLANAVAAQAPQDQPPPINILEERAFVRRFAIGITGAVTPLPVIARTEESEMPAGTPPVELRSNVDPNTKPWVYGFTAHIALSERLTLAVQPSIHSFNVHTVLDRFEGTDNASTSFDDRDRTGTDETIRGRHIDIPVMLRLYSKGHHDEGMRWIFEGGPVMRLTRNIQAVRRIFPPEGGELNETVALPTKNGFGVTAGIGAQLIDDFGIRAIPEFRYTRWITKPLDSIEARSRTSQIELLFTISF
jgi:hypothetical protein